MAKQNMESLVANWEEIKRICGDDADAAQEVALYVLTHPNDGQVCFTENGIRRCLERCGYYKQQQSEPVTTSFVDGMVTTNNSPEQLAMGREFTNIITAAIYETPLNLRELIIIEAKLFKNLSFEQIGVHELYATGICGVTSNRVNQIYKKSMAKIRRHIHRDDIHDLLHRSGVTFTTGMDDILLQTIHDLLRRSGVTFTAGMDDILLYTLSELSHEHKVTFASGLLDNELLQTRHELW